METEQVEGRVPHNLTKFIGRKAELAYLRNLTENYSVVGVFGTSGIGKSSICQEFVSRHHLTRTVWLDASNRMKLRSSLLSKITDGRNIVSRMSLTQLFRLVLNKMSVSNCPEILVVLDNYLDQFCPIKMHNDNLNQGNQTSFSYTEHLVQKLKLATFQLSSGQIVPTQSEISIPDTVPLLRNDEQNETLDHSVLSEERNEMAKFIQNIAGIHSTGQKVVVLITTISQVNLPNVAKRFKLNPLISSDAVELINSSFGFPLNDPSSTVTFATKLLNFPLYITQAGAIYRNDNQVHDLAHFSETYLSHIDRVKFNCTTATYKYSVVPIPQIMTKLDVTVISVLCILSYCPIKIKSSILTTFMTELLANLVGGSATSVPECLSILEGYGLISQDLGPCKTVTMHSLYQSEVFDCLTQLNLQDSFLFELSRVLNLKLQRFNKIPEEHGDSDMHQYASLASSIFAMYETHCTKGIFPCLHIPLFLDNTCTQLYTRTRYVKLENILENVINEITENPTLVDDSANREAFAQLSNRYIYSAAYSYMEFTKCIHQLLRVRRIMPNFCITSGQNHAQFTGRIYVTFMLALAVFMVAMVTVPFTLSTGHDPYSVVSWVDDVTVSSLVAASACVSGVQVYILLTICNSWLRIFLQYGLMGVYLGCYFVFESVVKHYNGSSRGENEYAKFVIIIVAYTLIFCHIAKPTLAIIYSSVKFAVRSERRVGRIGLLIFKNCHLELVNFLFIGVVLVMVCYTYPASVKWGSNVEMYAIMGAIVGVTMLIFFILLVTMFRNFISFSLWLSHKWAEMQINS